MPNQSPLIAVSTGFTDYGDYLGLAFSRPLLACGAVPVVTPYLETSAAIALLLESIDGLVLGVGRDLDPKLYRGQQHASLTQHSPHRDAFEIALVRAAIESGIPILGICRGMQVINVALGGSLWADHSLRPDAAVTHPGGDWAHWDKVVEATLAGRTPPPHPSHQIRVAPTSALVCALGEYARVNSYHHQSIAELGAGLRVVATALDGVIEAIEAPGAPALCLGIQWELQEEWQEDLGQLAIFRLLIEAAVKRKTLT
jgi:putative glutamine amidotransferase